MRPTSGLTTDYDARTPVTKPANSGPPAWHLREVRVFNQLQTGGAVVRESFDASGGFSELELSGSLLGACPGGSERVRFSWRFAEPVGSLRDGAKITADLSGAALAATGECKGGLAARAYVSVGGSNGDVNPFTAQ